MTSASQLSPRGALASLQSGLSQDGGPQPLLAVTDAGLDRDHEATLQLLLSGVVERRMSIINIQHGNTPADSIGMPVAAWIMGECLLQWALRWRPTEVRCSCICCSCTHRIACSPEGPVGQLLWRRGGASAEAALPIAGLTECIF